MEDLIEEIIAKYDKKLDSLGEVSYQLKCLGFDEDTDVYRKIRSVISEFKKDLENILNEVKNCDTSSQNDG